jgi:hypothetical protein
MPVGYRATGTYSDAGGSLWTVADYLAVYYCREDSFNAEPDRPSSHSTTGSNTRLQPGVGTSITNKDMMAMIHALAAWPESMGGRDLTDSEWREYIDVAALIQQQDSEVVAKVLHDYIVHFETSFDETVDYTLEWSKVMLLLRVMFALPEEPRPDLPAPGSWAGQVVREGPPSSRSFSFPVHWNGKRPELVAFMAGYNGPPYEAEREYRDFLKQFRFRDLGSDD